MKSLRRSLQHYLKKRPLQEGLNFTRLLERWSDLLGAYLAERMQPVEFERGVLVCLVVHSGFIQEVRFIEKEILKKLRLFEGGDCIKQLRWVTSAALRQQNVQDRSLIEQARISRESHHVLSMPALPWQAHRQISEQTAHIQDDALRLRLQGLFGKMATRQAALIQAHWRICEHCQSFFEPHFHSCPYCRMQHDV